MIFEPTKVGQPISHDTFKKYQVVVQCDNRLPLMARKIFNVLISFNDQQFGSEEIQRISEAEVLKRLVKPRKHIEYYREQFLLLGKTHLEFCFYNSNNQRIYGNCSMLSGAVVDEAEQEWIFSTPRKILEWIRKRNEQITLSLSVQHALNSKYSLALYEALLCEMDDRDEALVSLSPDHIRFITCGVDKHKEYKYLKKQVIKPSIEELSKNTQIIVTIDSEQRKSRKVAMVVFNVRRKNSEVINEDLLKELNQEYGVDLGMAKKIIKEYPDARIRNGLQYTKQKLEEGAIVALNGRKTPNVGGFVVNAIRNQCMPSHAGILDIAKEKSSRAGETGHCEKKELDEIKILLGRNTALRRRLEQQFSESSTGTIRDLIHQYGMENPIVKHSFLIYVANLKAL